MPKRKGKSAATTPRQEAPSAPKRSKKKGPEERLPQGLQRHDADSLAAEAALAIYERDQLLWLRLGKAHRAKCASFGLPALQDLQRQCPQFFGRHWSVENSGDHTKDTLTPGNVFGAGPQPAGAFYVSSILQKDPNNLKKFFAKVPFEEAPLLKKARAAHDDGVWLFAGSNRPTPRAKGRRAGGEAGAIRGRPEHTDAVDHSGTWHVQLQGTKTWYVRPREDAGDWGGRPPALADGAEGVVGAGAAGRRLRVECGEGDLLLVNTRAWWHRTEIAVQEEGRLSVSYARDFYLHGARPTPPTKGGKGFEGAKGNDETLDPRMRAARAYAAGEVVMYEGELPEEELPRSADPNCSYAEMDDGSDALVSLRRIRRGEPLTVGVGEGESDGEYEEWELDEETGEMVLVGEGD